jgi:hypothetical protein
MKATDSLLGLGSELIQMPVPGSVTDHKKAQFMRITTPNMANAWTHVVPALAKHAKSQGKRSLLGRDKGEAAYEKLEEKLYVAVLGLYGDGLLYRGASADECLLALLRSLVLFKEIYPNWPEAYSAAHTVFVEGKDDMKSTLAGHQRAVEARLY